MSRDTGAGEIHVRGARQNNLRDLDVRIPRGRLTVVSGLSGSGKSSLAFQTLYAEGQRRYVESFSTYARQFLERMDRPDVDGIDGLLPAVAVEQKNTIRSARATLGTLTELNDYLKELYAAAASLSCSVCGEEVRPEHPGALADRLLAEHDERRLIIAFRFHTGTGDDARVAFRFLEREGYGRVVVEGRTLDVDQLDPDAAPDGNQAAGNHDVVVDRLVVRAPDRRRLVESLETAYRMGDDRLFLLLVDGSTVTRTEHTRDLRHCGVAHPPPRRGLFSFNSPLGACETCNGFGRVTDIDMNRVVPDARLSLAMGAIRPWQQSKRHQERRALREFCTGGGIDENAPFGELPAAHRQLILAGDGHPGGWPGVRGWFRHLERKIYKMHVRILLARYRAYVPCSACDTTRFQPESLWYRLGEQTIAETLALSVADTRRWLANLDGVAADPGLQAVTVQLDRRLAYLQRVGLDYLTLDRQARTLSGGEVQRANLTTALGSGLVNTLFVLDEPSIGLHPRDADRLADVLAELTAHENTVVLVEHDPDMMRVADHLVELGPGPGAAGGRIVFAGPPQELAGHSESATARALEERAGPRTARCVDLSSEPGVVVRGARANNLKGPGLKGVDVCFPYGAVTALTGVSGSGKSTLMGQVLHRGILRRRGAVTDAPGEHDAIEGLDAIAEVIWIDQASPASSPRANAATYVKAWDAIRRQFAKTPLAKERGYNATTFSFNTGNGRCPACQGAGFERVEMQFLADVYLTCQACEGKRFLPEVLEVAWQGRTVADMLELTVAEALAVFGARTAASKRLRVLAEVGLSYLRLGQPLSTLSGGEAQRLKVAHHLGLAKTRRGLFLLDEPTTGLHLEDVDRLVANLRALAAAGNTVVVIEHHLDVIAAADHVVDLGPEGGAGGGAIVFEGPPGLLREADTHTGRHLAEWLRGVRPFETPATPPRRLERGSPLGVIDVRGARVHNLKDLSVQLPRGGRTVVSGVSGSGKSSLAFDLIFAEGQRRFLDCLSSYARQYITQLGRPDADLVAGIPPTVAIEQRTTRGGARSNVANVTEIEPFLRLLFARLGRLPGDQRLAPEGVAAAIAGRWPGQAVAIYAPAVRARKGFHRKVFANAVRLGHAAIVVDGGRRGPEGRQGLRKAKPHTISYVVAELETRRRKGLLEAVAEAAHLGVGEVEAGPAGGLPERSWSVDSGATLGPRPSLDPRLFSPHTELGACPACKGSGVEATTKTKTETEDVCGACGGLRLGPLGRSVTFAGKTLPELLALRPAELPAFLQAADLDPRDGRVAEGPLKAIGERCAFLLDVGLDYLSLDRRVPTLSGGEAQRIRLAAQLGAHLSGVLYVLDEPTIGLHPTDVDVLLGALDRLQERGNGVLMVEHDEATIRTADVVVDIGPGAGVDGGRLLATGTLDELMANPHSVTGRCLREPRSGVRAAPRALDEATWIELTGVQHHNLQGVDVRFPRGRLTVVSGVSGSGKSSLVHDVLTHAVTGNGKGSWKKRSGVEGLERLVRVDDRPIGKNPRSTPATYVGLWGAVRRLFAQLPESRLRGWSASRFSFNVAGGRCEACAGQGAIKLEMSFLPDAYIPCEVCGGRRFNRQTLHVAFNGHSIHDVLELPVSAAREVFERVPKVARSVGLLDDVGLGYLKLGQPSPTLSGGEAQRVKLVSELIGRSRDDTVVVLDEPSIGLHMADVPKLLEVVHRLVDAGATVVVIEHNLDVIREADWVIDLGPGGGDAGGHVLYQGPFAGLAAAADSRTGAWIRAQGAGLDRGSGRLRQSPTR